MDIEKDRHKNRNKDSQRVSQKDKQKDRKKIDRWIATKKVISKIDYYTLCEEIS